jgi:aryl-alcohol dehydrogenase-like predicted oxidoreductase
MGPTDRTPSDRLPHRTLGDGLVVPAIGYGAMVLTGLYGRIGRDEATAVLHHALDRGCALIDTAASYGDGANERLVGEVVQQRRADAVVATKWGIVPADAGGRVVPITYEHGMHVDARPERAGPALDRSLADLGLDVVDLWFLHIPDPAVPVEDTVGAMAEQVAAGKARHLGLSNVTGDTLRRAHAVHPIAAVQVEWSLWSRGVEGELLPVAEELGVGVVVWGPLGSGFLAGGAPASPKDFRTRQPRFAPEHLDVNRDRFAGIAEVAAGLGITTAQLALAWLLHRSPLAVPIPGTRSPDRVDENAAAALVELPAAVVAELDARFPPGLAAGPSIFGDGAAP